MKFNLIIFSMIILRCCWGPTDYQLMSALQNDTNVLKNLNGTYQIDYLKYQNVSSYNLKIVFNDTTNQVSGFSGCNRFFGSYTLKNNTLSFGQIGSTRMLCIEDANDIETTFLKTLKKADSVFFTEKGFSLFNGKTMLLSASKDVQHNIQSLEYYASSRGFYHKITINKKKISIINKRDASENIKNCDESTWNTLLKTANNIDIKNIPELKPPSKNHQFDGAALARLIINLNGNIYETQSFDHGNPPKAIAELVKEILSIAENIE